MTRSEVEATALKAGLKDPRVIVRRKRNGELIWQLYYGPLKARSFVQLPKNTDLDTLRSALLTYVEGA